MYNDRMRENSIKVVCTRFKPKEYSAMKQRADEAGLNVSEYLRLLVAKDLGRKAKCKS